MSYEASEAWDNAHDPQRAEPSGYCTVCGGEIYSDEELYDFDGLCAYCHARQNEVLECAGTNGNDKNCGTCKYHEPVSWACFNGNSPYVADFTLPEQSCDGWEAAT